MFSYSFFFFTLFLPFFTNLCLPFVLYASPTFESHTLKDKKTLNTKGQLSSFRFRSLILKNKRDLWVYTPSSYEWKKGPYPLLIVFDGQAYTSELIPGPEILDQLIAENKIPPLIALFVSSIDQASRNKELTCNPRFINCLTQELIPWISRRYFVTPSEIIVAGSSYGGLAAAYAAFMHPERFRKVLSQSGAYWWHPKDCEGSWLLSQYEQTTAPLSLQFYLDVGDQEKNDSSDNISMFEVNQNFSNILKNKGCKVQFHEFKGGHDYESWRNTFSIGLITLLGKSEK